jgi:hypothetical protein
VPHVRSSLSPFAVIILGALLLATGCSREAGERAPNGAVPPAGGTALTPEQARDLAAEAYVYLYPMVQNYQTIYQFALNPAGPEFKGPMNTIFNVARVFTPKDTTIITANSDTPYSYLMLDLRAEPYVVTLPKIEPTRYYSLQLVDLYTHNVDYLGTRKDGNGGGVFLVAGPGWQGATPPGITRVVRSPTSLMFGQFRTQLLNASDLEQVKAVQAGYRAQPLSAFLKQPPPPAAPSIAYPAISQAQITTDFWRYATFLLQFAPPLPGEQPVRERFARIGVRPGGPWPAPDLPDAVLPAIEAGAQEAYRQLDAESRTLTSSVGLFGTPTQMAGKYKERALGAIAGIYGNDVEETFYVSYQLDSAGKALDASAHDYTLTFAPGQLPPVDAFWSITMYDGKTRLMVENPIDRFLINSAMASSLKKNADGGVTLYLQHRSPGVARSSNWLPAPNGPMGAVLRMYLPRAEVLNGDWKAPSLVAATAPPTTSG